MASEGINILYCPTELMLADFFTKPLQGALFRKLSAVVMGHVHVNTLTAPTSMPCQERVEGRDSKGDSPGTDGRTDGKVPTTEKAEMTLPKKVSYADVTKRSLAPGAKQQASFILFV